ncbi:MAG: CDP-alcohol phosphatidyltransferase family protein [Nitrospirae bacterium]|nr:CDP-alcohol phosphatidyltransferase family protein [Nitrospirota bacterium]
MLGEKFGHFIDKPLSGLARRITCSPNSLTVTGFIITIFASFVLVSDLFIGGILILIGGAFDIMDGVVARVSDRTSSFGAFLDSVLDRYSDAAMFLGVSFYYLKRGNIYGVCLGLAVLIGAFLISYARARAEGLGIGCKVGVMERPERMIVLVTGLLTGMLIPVLWLLLVLTHYTAVQRIMHVRNNSR